MGAVMNATVTVFPPGPVETDITDETYFVSNGEFSRATLRACPARSGLAGRGKAATT
jgi:hypothetical protein